MLSFAVVLVGFQKEVNLVGHWMCENRQRALSILKGGRKKLSKERDIRFVRQASIARENYSRLSCHGQYSRPSESMKAMWWVQLQSSSLLSPSLFLSSSSASLSHSLPLLLPIILSRPRASDSRLCCQPKAKTASSLQPSLFNLHSSLLTTDLTLQVLWEQANRLILHPNCCK